MKKTKQIFKKIAERVKQGLNTGSKWLKQGLATGANKIKQKLKNRLNILILILIIAIFPFIVFYAYLQSYLEMDPIIRALWSTIMELFLIILGICISILIGFAILRKKRSLMGIKVISAIPKGPINFDLIFSQLNWIIKKEKEISQSNLIQRLDKIRNEICKIENYKKIKGADLQKIEEIVEKLCKIIRGKDNNILDSAANIFIYLLNKSKTLELIKKICYTFIKENFEKGNHNRNIFLILFRCGCFEENLYDVIINILNNKENILLEILRTGNVIDTLSFEERNKLYDIFESKVEIENDYSMKNEIQHWLRLLL